MEKVVVAYCKILSRNFSGKTQETPGKFRVTGPRLELWPSRVRSSSDHSTTAFVDFVI